MRSKSLGRPAAPGFKFSASCARADRLIEAFWRQLKHAWLSLNTLDSAAAVRLVAFYVREHNEKIPRAVLGARTPDEVYFSRRILAWRVSDTLSSATTRELLIEASKGLPDESANANVVVVTDGGSENFGEVDQLLKDSSSLRRVLAQIDIICSNSLIEAFWRQLKHGWLFLTTLDSTVAVRRLVAFYVREHNEKIPRAVLGARTPDEVYFGREENALERLSKQRKIAQRVRSMANRAASCYRCEGSRVVPVLRNGGSTRARRTLDRTYA